MSNDQEIPTIPRFAGCILGLGLLLTVCLSSHCRPPSVTPSNSHVELEITGCDAETAQAGFGPVLNQCALAVIDDGCAKLYFTQSLAEVESLLKSRREMLPMIAVVKPAVLTAGAIPTPPVPTRKTRFVFAADASKLSALGIAPAQLNAQLARIPGDHDFSSESFTASDGRTIPYTDLGAISRTEVMRPLVSP